MLAQLEKVVAEDVGVEVPLYLLHDVPELYYVPCQLNLGKGASEARQRERERERERERKRERERS